MEIGNCKDCIYRENYLCQHPKIGENLVTGLYPEREKEQDFLSYSYNEGGVFEVGDLFGCVHFRKKVE